MAMPSHHPRLLKRSYTQGELIADGFIHAAAIVAGLMAFSALFARVTIMGSLSDGLAMAVYAAGFFLLFGFSCAYNLAPDSSLKWTLRRFDHSSIYLMIAGTYTAILSQLPDHVLAWTLAAVVWGGTICGVGLKLFLPGRYDRVSLLAYVALGWVAVIAFKPLTQALPSTTLALIVVGGLLYTGGIVFYRWHSLKYQNAIWHGFVACAAACHFTAIILAVGRS